LTPNFTYRSEELTTCNLLYDLKSEKDILPILNKYDIIKINRYTVVKDKEKFIKKPKKHIFPFMITGIINSITVNKKGELLFNNSRSLYNEYANNYLTLEDYNFITNYIEEQSREYIIIDDVEIFFKCKDDIYNAYKDLKPFIKEKERMSNFYYKIFSSQDVFSGHTKM
jgi:hypothetical protein